ncbi:MAG: hypothetical protein KDI73_01190 [Candidatus Competibacteraceae bacterium]|nr:hypothetical protein [Candidatus Competibacteraceae bacterium]
MNNSKKQSLYHLLIDSVIYGINNIDPYRYAETLPLRDGDAALMGNGCALTTTDKNGKILYHNTFVINLAMNDHQVVERVTAGRGRWKIDNDNNSTLKTKGYHFEHN